MQKRCKGNSVFFILCSGENSTKFRHVISSKRSRIFVKSNEISHPLKRNFFLPKFRHDENSHPQNFAIAKICTREISPGRKFALAIFPQSEISLEMEAGCNENPRSDCCVCCTCTCNCLERSLERSSIFFNFQH